MGDNQGLNGTTLISLHRSFHDSPLPKGDKVLLLIWAPGTSHLCLVHCSLPGLSVLQAAGAHRLLWTRYYWAVTLLSTCHPFILGTLHGLTHLILTSTHAGCAVIIPILEANMGTSGVKYLVQGPRAWIGARGQAPAPIHGTPAPLAPLGLPPPMGHHPAAGAPTSPECLPRLCLTKLLCHLGQKAFPDYVLPCYGGNAGGAVPAPLGCGPPQVVHPS